MYCRLPTLAVVDCVDSMLSERSTVRECVNSNTDTGIHTLRQEGCTPSVSCTVTVKLLVNPLAHRWSLYDKVTRLTLLPPTWRIDTIGLQTINPHSPT